MFGLLLLVSAINTNMDERKMIKITTPMRRACMSPSLILDFRHIITRLRCRRRAAGRCTPIIRTLLRIMPFPLLVMYSHLYESFVHHFSFDYYTLLRSLPFRRFALPALSHLSFSASCSLCTFISALHSRISQRSGLNMYIPYLIIFTVSTI